MSKHKDDIIKRLRAQPDYAENVRKALEINKKYAWRY